MLSIILMSQPNGSGGGGYGQLIMIPLILVVFYFFMLRPQSQKAKQQKEFREGLDKGTRIVTIGGIHARILEIKETTYIVEAGNGIKFEIEKTAVNVELSKTLQEKKA